MTPRIHNPFKAMPEGLKAMMAIETSIAASGIEHSLLELVKMRASQINGCAFCLHMHSTDARAHGESEMRLYMLTAWRESSLYSERERAALAWTEALTRVAETGAPDADFALLVAERHIGAFIAEVREHDYGQIVVDIACELRSESV